MRPPPRACGRLTTILTLRCLPRTYVYLCRPETVTEPLFTVKVTVTEAPAPVLTVAEQLPGFWGVTTSLNVRPDPLGVPNVTIALLPLPQEPTSTETEDAAAVEVIVTVCAYAEPVPEKVIELGFAVSLPGGAGVPPENGGVLLPPPHPAINTDASAPKAARSNKRSETMPLPSARGGIG